MNKGLLLYIALCTAFVLSVAWCVPSRAETYLHAGAWSHHVGSDYDYNETHNLAALEHNNVMAGYFKNSIGDDSAMAAYRFESQWADHVEASVLVGASYGYRDCFRIVLEGSKQVCPLVVPAVTYTAHRVQPSVMVMGNAVAFSVRVELY